MAGFVEYVKDFLEFRDNRTALRAFREEKGRIFAFEVKRLEDAARSEHERRTAKNRERIEELKRLGRELAILKEPVKKALAQQQLEWAIANKEPERIRELAQQHPEWASRGLAEEFLGSPPHDAMMLYRQALVEAVGVLVNERGITDGLGSPMYWEFKIGHTDSRVIALLDGAKDASESGDSE
jgi:hypothetical protein